MTKDSFFIVFVKSLNFMLTFDTPDLPKKIDIRYEWVYVRPCYSKYAQVHEMTEIWLCKIYLRKFACPRDCTEQ